MKYRLLLLMGFVYVHATAQTANDPTPFAQSITAQDLKQYLFTVAGPAMEGRETGSPGQRKAAAYLEAQFKKIGLLPGNQGSYQISYPVKKPRATSAISSEETQAPSEESILNQMSSNVIGLIEGTDLKDEYIILTAHYDHLGKRPDGTIYFGADDDGSGTVAILELAEAFMKAKAAGQGPRRTVVFMTVSGEEKGLWGSEWYANHPIFPLEKTSVNLNVDMIGRIDPKRTYGDSTNYIYIVGDDKISSDLKPISEAINEKYTKLELDYKYNDPKDRERIYYRSDHFNFARKGVPIIFYFNGTHNDYHAPSDTPDKINYEEMVKRTHLIFYTAWEMANRNQQLLRDKPLN